MLGERLGYTTLTTSLTLRDYPLTQAELLLIGLAFSSVLQQTAPNQQPYKICASSHSDLLYWTGQRDFQVLTSHRVTPE